MADGPVIGGGNAIPPEHREQHWRERALAAEAQSARSDAWLAKANEVIRERAVEEIAQVLVTEGGMSPQDAGKVAPSLARAGIKPKTDEERA